MTSIWEFNDDEIWAQKWKKYLDGTPSDSFGKETNRCLHDNCETCKGTGRKKDGSHCIHMISCSCSRCSPGRMVCRKEAMNVV